MKLKLMPFYVGEEYLLETTHDETTDIQYFVGEWNGFSFCTHDNQNGVDMLCDRTIIGYICLSREDEK